MVWGQFLVLVLSLVLTKAYGAIRGDLGGPCNEIASLDVELCHVLKNPNECFLQDVFHIGVVPNVSSGNGPEDGDHFVEQFSLRVALPLQAALDEAMNEVIPLGVFLAVLHEVRRFNWGSQ